MKGTYLAEKRWENVGLLQQASSRMFSSSGWRGLEIEMGFGYCCGGGNGFMEAFMKWGFGFDGEEGGGR